MQAAAPQDLKPTLSQPDTDAPPPRQLPVLGARVLYVDVDRTLVRPFEKTDGTDTPAVNIGDQLYAKSVANIQILERFAKSAGVAVVVWSASGGAWAAQVISALGLQDLVALAVSKPSWYLDDLVDAGFAGHGDKWLDATKEGAWR